MKNGERTGPISQADLLSRAESGLLNRDELVWRDGFTDWVAAGTIKGLFRSPPPAPTAKNRMSWWQRVFRVQIFSNNGEANSDLLAVNRKATKRVPKVDHVANRKMIAQLRDDATDAQLVYAEMIRVSLRLNPVKIQIHSFIESIEKITDETPRPEIAQIVQSAIESVDLAKAVTELDKALTIVEDLGAKLIQDYASCLLKVWPKARQYIRHRWLDDSAKAAAQIREQLRCAVQAHQDDLVVIEKHFRQLQEFHPRYHAIMTRNDFWQTSVQKSFKFAARVFGDQLGGELGDVVGSGVAALGTHVWDAWRQKTDAKFVELFEQAYADFFRTTVAFTEKTEQEVEVVISAFVNDLNQFYQDIIAVLESAIEKTDLSKIYSKLHDPNAEEKIDDDRNVILELVMSNLRDQKISTRSEVNIKHMLGIS